MKFSEIYDSLLNESYNLQLENIERNLKNTLRKEKDPVIKQEILLLLLICLLKKNNIETSEMAALFDEFTKLSIRMEKKLSYEFKIHKDKSSRMYLDVFYRTNIYRFHFLERLYHNLDLSERASTVRVIRKDFTKNELFFKGKMGAYAGMLMEKAFSNYGTSFRYLGVVILVSVGFFGVLYYIVDAMSVDFFVGGGKLERIDYYLYISLATFSNLGADTSMAATIPLRLLFGIEQVIGLLVFGVFLNLVNKKFD